MNTKPTVSRTARIVAIIYVALMLTTFLVEATDVDASVAPTVAQSADEPDAAICHPYAWQHKFGTVFWTKLFPGTGYEVTIDYEFKYNGCHVYIVWRDCEVNWALGWNMSDIKCRHWGNSTNTRLAVQVNYQACLVVQGGPICSSGWAKRVLGVNGQTISTEGSFLN